MFVDSLLAVPGPLQGFHLWSRISVTDTDLSNSGDASEYILEVLFGYQEKLRIEKGKWCCFKPWIQRLEHSAGNNLAIEKLLGSR
ncbi:hypothetical protein PanWU01x14_089140 [Parasponia andersonii]|uniref:Uncharacterized protein n=1 Tax=Parasponia andersonii TaxID=3476 RepID=A0A2P5D7B8_PARAD|nr:hypothetical protein PanWU01x14_089140 [Parasponia andersonii]